MTHTASLAMKFRMDPARVPLFETGTNCPNLAVSVDPSRSTTATLESEWSVIVEEKWSITWVSSNLRMSAFVRSEIDWSKNEKLTGPSGTCLHLDWPATQATVSPLLDPMLIANGAGG